MKLDVGSLLLDSFEFIMCDGGGDGQAKRQPTTSATSDYI